MAWVMTPPRPPPPTKSCEYRGADGVYHRDADAGEHRGEGQGNSTISTR